MIVQLYELCYIKYIEKTTKGMGVDENETNTTWFKN